MSDLNKFNIYRCPDPIKSYTSQPWYRFTDVCPCNPNDSNVTGRGFTACPFGIQNKEETPIKYSSAYQKEIKSLPKGSLYAQQQYVPPQLEPRQLARIGQEWRSAN